MSTSSSSTPVVTVLLSSHNGEKYLRQALDSMAAQTFTDWEWVLVDDGSTDQTLHIFEEYRSRFGDRIKLIHHEQKRGLTESLNAGLAKCSGRYVARMDDDDVSHPDRLARQVEVMEADTALVLLGAAGYRLDEGTGLVRDYMPHYDPIWLRLALCWHNPFLHSSVMYRSCVLRKMQLQYPAEYPAAEDYGLWAILAAVGKIAVLSDRLITYRSRSTSVTGQRRTLQLASSARVSEWYTRELFKAGPFAQAKSEEVRAWIEDSSFPLAERIALVKRLFVWAGRSQWATRRETAAGFLQWAAPFLDRFRIPALFKPQPFRLLLACGGHAFWYLAHRLLNRPTEA